MHSASMIMHGGIRLVAVNQRASANGRRIGRVGQRGSWRGQWTPVSYGGRGKVGPDLAGGLFVLNGRVAPEATARNDCSCGGGGGDPAVSARSRRNPPQSHTRAVHARTHGRRQMANCSVAVAAARASASASLACWLAAPPSLSSLSHSQSHSLTHAVTRRETDGRWREMVRNGVGFLLP